MALKLPQLMLPALREHYDTARHLTIATEESADRSRFLDQQIKGLWEELASFRDDIMELSIARGYDTEHDLAELDARFSWAFEEVILPQRGFKETTGPTDAELAANRHITQDQGDGIWGYIFVEKLNEAAVERQPQASGSKKDSVLAVPLPGLKEIKKTNDTEPLPPHPPINKEGAIAPAVPKEKTTVAPPAGKRKRALVVTQDEPLPTKRQKRDQGSGRDKERPPPKKRSLKRAAQNACTRVLTGMARATRSQRQGQLGGSS